MIGTIVKCDMDDCLYYFNGECTRTEIYLSDDHVCDGGCDKGWEVANGRSNLNDLPSAQPDLDEWCTDCSEYDQERHCCPRWNRVIRQSLKDAQPTTDARENVKANLVIAGYKRDGSTQWFECSVCGGAVDFTDNFCKHCGAQIRGES